VKYSVCATGRRVVYQGLGQTEVLFLLAVDDTFAAHTNYIQCKIDDTDRHKQRPGEIEERCSLVQILIARGYPDETKAVLIRGPCILLGVSAIEQQCLVRHSKVICSGSGNNTLRYPLDCSWCCASAKILVKRHLVGHRSDEKQSSYLTLTTSFTAQCCHFERG
jgi:hypothetical protein